MGDKHKFKQIGSNKRLGYISTIAGLIFAVTLVLGHNIASTDSIGERPLYTLLQILILALFMACLVTVVISCSETVVTALKKTALESGLSRITRGDRKFFFLVWLITFLSWIPGLLSAFPGIYDIDGAYQLMWFEQGKISAHHPVLHTYLLGGIIELGNRLFGSYEAGLLCYSLFQMFCLSAMFAYICKRTCRWLPHVVQVLVIVSYMILPYHVVLSFTTTKDVLFAGVFAIWVLKTFECVKDMKVFFQHKKKQIGFMAIVLMMCALRNTGYYIFLFMLPFFLFYCRRYWKNVFCMGLITILIWNVYTGPVYRLLGVEKGSVAEVLSVPMQQLSRTMAYNGYSLSKKEQEAIRLYIPEYGRYTPRVSDSVKDTFNGEAFSQDPDRFVKLWSSVGLKHPFIYLEAFISNNIGFWYPLMKYPDTGTYLSYIVYQNTGYKGDWPEMTRTSYLPGVSGFYEKLTEQGIYHQIPGAFIWYSGGILFWMLVLGICISIYRRRYELLLPFSILVGLWGTLMLSPVVVFRYVYPLMVSVPVILSMCIGESDENYGRDNP
jgi:hypothetical protein